MHAALHTLVCISQGNLSSARKIPQHARKHSAKCKGNKLTPSSHLTSNEKGLLLSGHPKDLPSGVYLQSFTQKSHKYL